MACPFCNRPEEYFTGDVILYKIEWPHAYVNLACFCDRCNKSFWQRHEFKTDDYYYENVTNEEHEKDMKEMKE